jgi:hypothetical protein
VTYNYLITSKAVDGEEMKNFKNLQSYNYFQSGNVDRILHFVAPDNNIVLKANVRSSQTVSSPRFLCRLTAFMELL